MCGEQTIRGACLERLLASGTRIAMAVMACKQGDHLFFTMSSCFDKYAIGAQTVVCIHVCPFLHLNMDNPNSCLTAFMLRRYDLFVGNILTLKRTPIYIRYRKILLNSTYMRYLEFVAIV